MGERIFLDTFFAQALLNRRDQYHAQAQALSPRLRTAKEVWITEAVLIEIGNALSAINRTGPSCWMRDSGHRRPPEQVVYRSPCARRCASSHAASSGGSSGGGGVCR